MSMTFFICTRLRHVCVELTLENVRRNYVEVTPYLHTYLKRDLYVWKETWISEKRPISKKLCGADFGECAHELCRGLFSDEQVSFQMNWILFRCTHLCNVYKYSIELTLENVCMTPYLHTYLKRDLYIWKEMCTPEKPCTQDSWARHILLMNLLTKRYDINKMQLIWHFLFLTVLICV